MSESRGTEMITVLNGARTVHQDEERFQMVLLNIWPAPKFGAGQMFRQKSLDQKRASATSRWPGDMISLHRLNAINH
jgi:hypothetical protein